MLEAVKESDRIDSLNEKRLSQLTMVAKSTIDRLINMEVDGLLSRPKTGNELVEFNDSVNDIIISKLRNNLGV